jgi:ATPase family associated with various cellular activities (AAA)
MTPDLPDLDTDADIVADNVRAVGAIYFAYLLDEMGAFRVLERIAELFRQGLLPLGQGRVAEALFHVARPGEGMRARDRAAFYAQVLGVAGGQGGGEPNREFLSLWLRFLVAVSMFARQHGAAGLTVPPTPANATVRAAARDLAINASLHGGGVVQFAARELAEQVQRMIELLENKELRSAFGARDIWQVIDQVNQNHLGGARNVARYRTQAEAGGRVLQWLAAHAARLGTAAQSESGDSPDDADLVQAVEQWLAVSGVGDDAIEQHSQPEAPPATTRRPTGLPAVAQELLAALGVSVAAGDAGPGTSSEAAEHLNGVVALLQGARGTGKTLAAHVLAHALSLGLLRVDLAQVVSKYLGETEKHLDAIFDRAERAGAILFLDEADALFAKRTDVKDAHDRYANAAVNYLLQRIARYEGPMVLATSLGGEIDAAFTPEEWRRRVWRVVRFPRPRG